MAALLLLRCVGSILALAGIRNGSGQSLWSTAVQLLASVGPELLQISWEMDIYFMEM